MARKRPRQTSARPRRRSSGGAFGPPDMCARPSPARQRIGSRRVESRRCAISLQSARPGSAGRRHRIDRPGQGCLAGRRGLMRELGSAAPVDARTKFMIASNTKGMSTLLLSVLADEGGSHAGIRRWSILYPSFRLGSDATTKATLVRNLVCACTGLPRKDYAFILADSGAPASDTYPAALQETQPTSRFGELFQYNNLMAAAARPPGRLARLPESPSSALPTTRPCRPGSSGRSRCMTRLSTSRSGRSGEWARPPGFDVDGRMVEMSNYFNLLIAPHRPAAGMVERADMARYAQLELSKR